MRICGVQEVLESILIGGLARCLELEVQVLQEVGAADRVQL